jgi:Ni/Co efflux regulator RcnB
MRRAPAPPIVRTVRPAEIRSPGSAPPRADRFVIRRQPGHGALGHGPVTAHREYRRIDRGHSLPQSWWGPRYQIDDWSSYRLPQPMHGGRWVRYYDDALMVDRQGRVHDGRYGMAWDEWGDEWAYDDRGVPAYVGDGDFYPGGEDYAWVGGEGRYAEDRRGPYPDEDCGSCDDHRGYRHQAPAYGYGYGHGGGMVVTETTVTTSPTVVVETTYEDQVVEQARAHQPRRHRSRYGSKIRRLYK